MSHFVIVVEIKMPLPTPPPSPPPPYNAAVAFAAAAVAPIRSTSQIPLAPRFPSSLFDAAHKESAIAAMRYGTVDRLYENHTPETESVATYLKGRHLLEYVDACEGLMKMNQHFFSKSAFQRILIRILEERTSLANSKEVRVKLTELVEQFKSDVGFEDKKVVLNVALLGLTVPFYQPNLRKNNHYNYYKIKDLSFVGFVRFNCPSFENTELWNLIPLNQSTFNFHSEHDTVTDLNIRMPLRTGECLFYNRLRGMVNASQKLRHHEVLAYGFSLVSDQQFSKLGVSEFVDVYGLLAVSLASVCSAPAAAFGCLEKMKRYAILESCKINAGLYRQKVYAIYGQFKEENREFDQLYNAEFRPPVVSQQFLDLVSVHAESEFRRIENLLAEYCAYCRFFEDGPAGTRGLPLHKISRMERKIYKVQRWLDQVSSLIVDWGHRLYETVRCYKAMANAFEGAIEIKRQYWLNNDSHALIEQSRSVLIMLHFLMLDPSPAIKAV